MIDSLAPKLKRLSLPSKVDVSGGTVKISVAAEADDEGGSGIDRIVVFLDGKLGFTYGAGSNFTIPGIFGENTFQDSTPNTGSVEFELTNLTAPGVYNVTQVWLYDMAGNSSIYSAGQLQELGIRTSMTVSGGKADSTAPILQDLLLPETVDVSRGTQDVLVTAHAQDNAGGSGIDRLVVFLDGKLGFTYGAGSNFSIPGIFGQDTFHDSTPERASVDFTLTDVTAPGTYNVTQVWLYDMAGNQSVYSNAQLQALGIRTSMTVTGGKSDTTAPTLQQLLLPETIDVSKGTREVVVTAQAQDNAGGSGIDRVVVFLDGNLGFTYGAGSNFSIPGIVGEDTFHDNTPNSGSVNFSVTSATAPGTYRVTQVWLYDIAGNSSIYSTSELQALGIRTTMRVTDGTNPPLPSATIETRMASDDIVHSISTNAWPLASNTPFFLTINYDALTSNFQDVTLKGVSGSSYATSVTEVGNIGTISISGSATAIGTAPVSIELKLTAAANASDFTYAVKTFTVNGKPQNFGADMTGTIHRGGATADLIRWKEDTALIDGGDGVDTVSFSLPADAYKIAKHGSGFSLDNGAGSSTQLQNIERLHFHDKAIALDIDGPGGQVYRLYQAAFDRKPDSGGLGFWMHQVEQNVSLLDAARSFISSEEFANRYGIDISNEHFVKALYQNVLHRTPDPTGFDFWMTKLGENVQRADMLLAFSESAENVAQVTGVIENGFEYTPWM